MRITTRFLSVFTLSLALNACTSGKSALKNHDYYEAVINSVHRLRETPSNRKAMSVLTRAYPPAVKSIDDNVAKGINSSDPKKWRQAVAEYEKIHFMNTQIMTSLKARKLISNIQTRYNELVGAKAKAASEVYDEGISQMMKGTRAGYTKAYFDFKECNDLKQGFKESPEMMAQAEFKATLRVAFAEFNSSKFINYPGIQPTVSSLNRQFLSFKPLALNDTVAPDQYLRVHFTSCQLDKPSIGVRKEEITKQIKTGEKKGADGKTQDIMTTIKAQINHYRKTINADGYATVTITDASKNILGSINIHGHANWSCDWTTFSGDERATDGPISFNPDSETYPVNQDLIDQALNDLLVKLGQELKTFYSQY